jgi:peptide-methionine (S)-S-oxide reductase
VDGVLTTEVGYTGGDVLEATYEMVCSGTTGHAEAVHLTFDPARVSYERLLDIFWENHDPTQVGGQGLDLGDQYRSAVFFHTPEQEAVARASREALAASGAFTRPITTVIEAAPGFVRAEEYHQQYYEKKGLVR